MSSAVATRPTNEVSNGERHKPHEQLPSIAPPRLPYHPAVQERFGIDRASWKALVEAIFPNATSVESVILALSYCRARKLDPFKRNVHIVPIWNKDLRRYVDTIWPGIGELRTTAFRTGEYAGRGATTFGDDITKKVGSKEMTFPEWAQVSVFRMVKGQRVEFSGPRVYWLETYANIKRDDETPNDMWENRPRGQIDKCAEAAALRAAFPEEIGSDYIPEEVAHSKGEKTVDGSAVETMDALADRLLGSNGEIPKDTPDEPTHEDAGERPQTTDEIDADLIRMAQTDFGVATDDAGVDFTLFEFQGREMNEATRSAIAGLAKDRKAAINQPASGKKAKA